MAAEFCADGRTDMTKLIVAFRKIANAPKRRCNECRTYLKNLLVNPIPTFPHFCPLLVKMRLRDPQVILLRFCENRFRKGSASWA